MKLLDLVNNSIDDETNADSEYEDMMKLVESEEGLSDAEKALITGILFKIETDEETHQVLLKIIRDTLSKSNLHKIDTK